MRRISLFAALALLAACASEPEPVANRFERTHAEIENKAKALEADVENQVRAVEAEMQQEVDALANQANLTAPAAEANSVETNNSAN